MPALMQLKRPLSETVLFSPLAPKAVTPRFVTQFDGILDQYLSAFHGPSWRTMCHQSAKVAAKALNAVPVKHGASLCRVEMAVMMKNAQGFVHIGDPDDERIDGKVPMHFVVRIGDAAYDPTFWQLRFVKTPLDLPQKPFFFAPNVWGADAPEDSRGFRWSAVDRPTGTLLVGYKLQPAPLPLDVSQPFMPDDVADKHARQLHALWASVPGH